MIIESRTLLKVNAYHVSMPWIYFGIMLGEETFKNSWIRNREVYNLIMHMMGILTGKIIYYFIEICKGTCVLYRKHKSKNHIEVNLQLKVMYTACDL